MNNRIELRWFCERVEPYHKAMKLQYREYIDHPMYATDWQDVPEVWKNDELQQPND